MPDDIHDELDQLFAESKEQQERRRGIFTLRALLNVNPYSINEKSNKPYTSTRSKARAARKKAKRHQKRSK